ncbi:hypothetical protein ACF0H5_007801 [Mactra antiquata]
MTIKAVCFIPGEANSPHPDEYACQFPAMINDWRTKFSVASKGQTNKQFPFGFVQLAANVNRTLHVGFPDLRWSQTAKYGYVPNPLLPNVFMAVAMDLPDFDSPFGTIHPRDKQDVAVRLALAGRGVAYGENSLDFQGPFPSNFQTNNHTMTIEFDHGTSAIDVRSNDDFEVCCTHAANYSSCQRWEWKPAPVIGHDQSSVTIDTHACIGYRPVLNSVRYAWEVTPCFVKQCGIYDQNTDLPAPPFIKHGPF